MQEAHSIRSSNYNVRPLALRRVKASIQEEVCSLLTKHIKGVRNVLRPENSDIFSKYKFYGIPRHGRDVPGFLVMRKDATYFYNPRRQETYLLRLRLSSEIREDTILIGTLYYFEKKLVLEDVFSWKQVNVWETKPFEERWELLRDFFNNHWVEDLYLQKNLEILPTKILSLKNVLDTLDPEMGIDFQPNEPNRKRFFWFGGNVKRPLTKEDLALAPAFKAEPRKPTKLAVLLPKEPLEPKETFEPVKPKETKEPKKEKELHNAICRANSSMPDVYELFHPTTKVSIGFASVQEYSVSQDLLNAKPDSLVKIAWNNDFSKYQILSLK